MRYFTHSLAIVAFVVISHAAACIAADPASSVVYVTSQSPSCVGNSCWMTTRQGSGVVIGDLDGQPVVATCLHNLGDRQKCRVSVTAGQATYPAAVIGYSDAMDVALLTVRMPLQASLEAVAIDEQPDQSAAVEMVGFPEGRFTRVRSRVVSHDAKWNLITDRPTQQGQSGGALLSDRGLAGVVKWTDNRSSYATPGFQVAAMARHYRVRLKIRARGVIAPLPPAPLPPPPKEPSNPWLPDPANIELMKQLDLIGKRLDAIEAKSGIAGSVGPQGPPGKDGTNGKDGVAGKDAKDIDVSAITSRLNVLENRPIQVQLLDENGVVMSEQVYAPGAPLKFQFNPVKSETK